MLNFIYFLYVTLLILSVGLKFTKILRIDFGNELERIIFSVALGLGILAYLVFAIGLNGLLYRWFVLGTLVILTIWTIPEIREFGHLISKNFRIISPGKEGVLIITILSTFALLGFIASFAPVTSMDSLAYHLSSAKIYIQHHRIIYIPYIYSVNLPATIDMIYLLGILLRSDTLSQLFSWLIGIILVLSIYSLGFKYCSRRVALLASLIFYSVPLVTMYSSVTYVDLGTALFIFLAVYAFLNWITNRTTGWLILASINCGFAAGSKIIGLVLLLLLPIAILIFLFQKIKFRLLLYRMLMATLIAGFIALPWYLKSYIYTGNPIFPFMYKIFGARNWNPFSDAALINSYSHNVNKNLWELLTLPISLTLGFFEDASIGPIFLVLVPFTLYKFKGVKREIKFLFLTSITLFIIFGLITNVPRGFVSVLVIFSIISAYNINQLWPRGKIIGVGIVSLLSLVTLLWTIKQKKDALLAASGIIEQNEYLSQNTPFYNQYSWINVSLPLDSRVLLWSVHSYFLDREYVLISPVNQGLIDFSRLKDAKSLLSRIKELKITHIFYSPGEGTTVNSVGDFLDNLQTELVRNGDLRLLKQWPPSNRYGENNGTFLFAIDYNRI